MSVSGRHTGSRPGARGGTGLEPVPGTAGLNPARRGLTLIELMVSVAILAVMILIVNSLMVQSRHAVRMVQNNIRANADARGAISRIRADLASITKDGYLAIVSGNPVGSPIVGTWPVSDSLMFTAVGPYRSLWIADACMNGQPTRANEARIDYGIFWPGAVPSNGQVLFRRAILLTETSVAYVAAGPHDHEPVPLVATKNWGRGAPGPPRILGIPDCLTSGYAFGGNNFPGMIMPPGCPLGPPAVAVPPANLDQVSASSCFLAPQCQSLRVWWTDGTTTAPPNAVLNWYGVDNPRDAQWGTRNQYYQTSNPDCPEFVLPNSNNAYCALWTSQSKAYWPKGLRIVLQLIDTAHTYEVIVELPQ